MRHQSGQLGRMDRKRLAVVGAVCFVLLALALRAYMGGGSEEKKKVAHGRPGASRRAARSSATRCRRAMC